MAITRLMDISEKAFERAIVRIVEEKFEALRALPDDVAEVPFIDGTFNPHAPPEQLVELKARVRRALRARRWFEFEAPWWAQPLPLRMRDTYELLNKGYNRRAQMVSRYGQMLISSEFDIKCMPPFESMFDGSGRL